MQTRRKIRIFLLMLAFGLASVPFVNDLYDRWTEVYVNLPKVESDSPIFIFPKQILTANILRKRSLISKERDLSLYDFGGNRSDCGFILRKEARKCEIDKKKARDFIWKHWQNKKRAYLVVTFSSIDMSSDTHIFIEPDENGKWHIVWIWGETGSQESNKGNLNLIELSSVKYKRATEDDYDFEVGTYYLSFLNENGEEVEAL